MAFRVPCVISKLTGDRVLLWTIEARCLTYPAAYTSATFSFTRSHPRNLLSMTRLKSASSQICNPISRRTRIAQTCFGSSGRFWPTMRPLFQAGRQTRMAGRFAVGMVIPPIHQTHHIFGTVPMAKYSTSALGLACHGATGLPHRRMSASSPWRARFTSWGIRDYRIRD
jgi:hypothetical protein